MVPKPGQLQIEALKKNQYNNLFKKKSARQGSNHAAPITRGGGEAAAASVHALPCGAEHDLWPGDQPR